MLGASTLETHSRHVVQFDPKVANSSREEPKFYKGVEVMTDTQPLYPAPDHLSLSARAVINSTPPPSEYSADPRPQDVSDPGQWRAMIADIDAFTSKIYDAHVEAVDVDVDLTDIEGVRVYSILPSSDDAAKDGPIFLDFHGGALFSCGGDLAWKMAALAAAARPGVTWAPDYRMPPDHPYPAALDDALTVYRAALRERGPQRVIVCGTSAGGNLAAAVLLRARDEGLPMPRALVLNSPELDLTESGDSFLVFRGMGTGDSLMSINRLYAGNHDLADPYLSPLFGDVSGFPPTLLWCGTRDFFLSNTARMHRKLVQAGVETELHLGEGMPHGGFGGLSPEDLELGEIVRAFERRHSV